MHAIGRCNKYIVMWNTWTCKGYERQHAKWSELPVLTGTLLLLQQDHYGNFTLWFYMWINSHLDPEHAYAITGTLQCRWAQNLPNDDNQIVMDFIQQPILWKYSYTLALKQIVIFCWVLHVLYSHVHVLLTFSVKQVSLYIVVLITTYLHTYLSFIHCNLFIC